MLRVMAVLRTAFLIFIVVYTLWTITLSLGPEVVTVSRESLAHAHRTIWLAVAWIALDTIVGWLMASWHRHRTERAKAAAARATPTPASTPASTPTATSTSTAPPTSTSPRPPGSDGR